MDKEIVENPIYWAIKKRDNFWKERIEKILDEFFPCLKGGHEEYDGTKISKFWCDNCEMNLQLKASLFDNVFDEKSSILPNPKVLGILQDEV